MQKVKFGEKEVDVWGFDTETVLGQPFSYQLTCGQRKFYYENKISNKHFREAFFKQVLKECENEAVIFSYNLFFEITVLFRDKVEILSENRFKFFGKDYFVEGMVENPTPRMVLFGNGKRIYFVDASRFFTGDRKIDTLEKVANSFLEVPKMKRPKYLGQRKPKSKEKDYFIRYSMIDALLAEQLGEIILEYHNLANIDEICFSISHLAGKSFKKNFTDNKGLDAPNESIEEKADEARFGGYRAGHILGGVYRDIIHLDLDSAYPFAMTIIPAFFGGKYYSTTRFNDFGIYKIETVLPENDRPFFQKKVFHGQQQKLEFIEQGSKVVFWTTGYEIKTFKSVFKNWKYKILDGCIWKGKKKYKPLAEWVKKYHKLKFSIDKDDKKKAPQRQVYKLFLNVISGKADSVIFDKNELWITKEGTIERGHAVNGSLKNFFVASFIRAIPRSIAWKTGFLTESLFEVTDSVSIRRDKLSLVKLGDGLGKWGFETGKKEKTDLIFEKLGTYFYFPQKGKLKKGPVKFALQGFHSTWKEYFRCLKLSKDCKKTHFVFENGKKVKREEGKSYYSYKKMRMNKIKESLRNKKPEKILTFEKKKFNFVVDTNFKKEVLKWLKQK